MILIISDKNDLHAKKVKTLLKKNNAEFVNFDFTDYPTSVDISFDFEGNGFFRIGEQTINIEDIKSIYLRRIKIPNPMLTDENVNSLVAGEFMKIILSLDLIFNNLFWLPKLKSATLAEDKMMQIVNAKNCGLILPETLISNNEVEVAKFGIKNNLIAMKALRKSHYVNDEKKTVGLYTQKFTTNQLIDNLDAVRYSPVIYQKYIEKAFELRITVVGTQFFACKIDSQNTDDEATKVDFRHYKIKKSDYSIYELPEEIKVKLLAFMKTLDLNFGCIDMIVTPEGEYVFLEINPNGQWLWIEDNTGLKISEAIAEALIQNKVN